MKPPSLLEDINLGFQALAEAEVICTDLRPIGRSLIEVQAASNFNDPAIVDPNFAIVQIWVESDLKHDVDFEQTLLKV